MNIEVRIDREEENGRPMDRLVHGNEFLICLKDAFDQIRERHDLKKIEIQIIMYLQNAGEEDNTASAIVQCMRLNKGQVSKTLDALHKRGFVNFRADEKDRRYVHYYVDEGAKDVIADLDKAWAYMSTYVFKDVPAEEQKTFFEVCKKLHKNMMELSHMKKFDINQEESKEE